MQAQSSTTSIWNKKETSPLDGMLRKSFPALMSEQSSWGIEDIQFSLLFFFFFFFFFFALFTNNFSTSKYIQ